MDSVLKLSNCLRADGVDCQIDQYEESPPEGWPIWCLNQVEESEFVLVVCTHTYERRFLGKEEPGRGKGVTFEGYVITQSLYEEQGKNTKFVPLIFFTYDSSHIPIILKGSSAYDLSEPEGYDQLYRRLTNQPLVTKPPLGKTKIMPPRGASGIPSLPKLQRKQGFLTRTAAYAAPGASSSVDEYATKPRLLDAAIPSHVVKDRSTELLVLIRLPNSEGLKGVLQGDEDAQARPEDARSTPFCVTFPFGPTGKLERLRIEVKISSPDFSPADQAKNIFVPADADSDVISFLLTPRRVGKLVLLVELQWEEAVRGQRRLLTKCVSEASELPFQSEMNLVQMEVSVSTAPLRIAQRDVPRPSPDTDGLPPVAADSLDRGILEGAGSNGANATASVILLTPEQVRETLRVKAVTIALAISNGTTRQHIAQQLDESHAEIRAKTSVVVTDVVNLDGDQAKVLDWLRRYFSDATARPLILISDLLKGPADPIDGFLTRECQKRFAEHALGTIAILQSRERLTDIDRTIVPDVSRDDLTHAMVMLLGRLEYLRAPVPGQAVDPQSIVIRPLRGDNEAEFRSYFQLRHRVYSQMGYLDDFAERSLSKLEMNEADVHSLHLGAYCRSGVRELLAGCARVVTNSEADPALVDLFETIADRDPVSKQRLGGAYQLGLPIFHTYRAMTPIIGEIFRKRQKCGELSCVIVDRAFRGSGISNRLISEALERAVGRGVARIFVECLKIHEPLYEKHGFKRISGFEASVIDVKRTMIAMELQPDVITRIAEKLE
jgi:GNAT superfamily N-acetyltransferase